jgi:hypothetical protein
MADLDFVLLECVGAESESVGPVSEDVACVAFCLIEDDVSVISVCELLVLVLDCVAAGESIQYQHTFQHVIPTQEDLRDVVELSEVPSVDEVFADFDFELALFIVALPVTF